MTSLDAVKCCLTEQKSLLKNKYKISKVGIFGSYAGESSATKAMFASPSPVPSAA
jgi:predicted nucleotidyltransferase